MQLIEAFAKARKKANFRNRYKQISYLTLDTVWKSDTNTTKRHIQESQGVIPFPPGDHMAARHSQDNMAMTNTNKKNPQKKYRLGTVSKKITGGLKLVSRYQPRP